MSIAEDQQAIRDLSNSIALLRGELVQIRQEAQRRAAQEFGGVDEWEYANASGGTIVPKALMAQKIMVTSILAVTDNANGSTTTLKLGDGMPAFTVLTGISVIAPIKRLFKAAERPSLINTGTTATMYIHLFGYAVPSAANAL